MGTVILPNLLTNGEAADADEVMGNFDNFVGEFNGSIDAINLNSDCVETIQVKNLNITAAKLAEPCVTDAKVDYTSSRMWQCQELPDTNGGMIVRVAKAHTTDATPSDEDLVITFSSDSEEWDGGGKTFSAAPTLLGMPICELNTDDQDEIPFIYVKSISTTTCTLRLCYGWLDTGTPVGGIGIIVHCSFVGPTTA